MFLIKKLSINTMPDFTRISVPRFFANNLVKIILRCVHFEYLTHYKFFVYIQQILEVLLETPIWFIWQETISISSLFLWRWASYTGMEISTWVWIVPWQQILSKMLSIMIGCLFSKYLQVNRKNACTTLVCYFIIIWKTILDQKWL